ncbi:MAG: hypothetical protein P9L90_05375 [Candidatus Aadella gelida]|nr:hypothetical protein [Candidatus Aadella gelida]
MSAKEKAYDTYIEMAKQILIIATGAIVLSLSLLSDVFGGDAKKMGLLIASWGLFLITIICGIFFFQTMTGNMDRAGKIENFDINKKEIRITAILMNIFFVTGLTLFITFGTINLVDGKFCNNEKKGSAEREVENKKNDKEKSLEPAPVVKK